MIQTLGDHGLPPDTGHGNAVAGNHLERGHQLSTELIAGGLAAN
jgi:hypothetical protein